MPVNPGEWEYFWYQLPWGLPGLVTFIAGVLLCWASMREGARVAHRRSLYIPLGLLAFALGSRGLQAAAAALVLDGELYRSLATVLLLASMPAAPFLMDLLDYLSRRRYRILNILFRIMLTMTIAAMGWVGYTGAYPDPESIRMTGFGFVGSLNPLADIWLGSMAVLILPAGWVVIRRRFGPSMQRAGRPVLHVGVGSLILLVVVDGVARALGFDLPSTYGFTFVSLLLVGYDFFRFVLRDLNRLLFRELGLFYLINVALAAIFIGFALTAIIGLSPESFHAPFWPSVVPALLGVASTFGIGILIAGMNPREPLNQYAATSSYCIAFAMLTDLIMNSGMTSIVTARLAQICWIVIPGLMSAFPRFVLVGLGQPLPRFMPLLDLTAAVTALLALSPWSIPGFFEDRYGRFPAVGPVIMFFSLMAVLLSGYLLHQFIRSYRRVPRRHRIAIIGVSSIFMSLWFSWPATVGLTVPRVGSIVVVPVALLAFFSIRRGALQSDQVVYRINQRLTFTVFIIAPLVMAMMLPLVLRESKIDLALMHLAFMGLPILLFAYQLTHFLSRPVSDELKRSFDEQTRAKTEAEQAVADAETARAETEAARRREEEARREAERVRGELEEEIRMASRIQESLLPRELPEAPGARMAYRYAPMLAVGGDFLDLTYAPSRNLLGFFICDVSGHGVPAAFVASMVKMALRDWGETLLEPSDLLTRIHERMRGKLAGHTLTACAGCINLADGTLRTASAGHPPPVLVRAGGDVRGLDVRGRLLMDHPLWKAAHVSRDYKLEPGDKLVLYTDGLIEARSPRDEILGDERLLELLSRYGDSSPGDLCSGIHGDIRQFTGNQELDDDFTILAIEHQARPGAMN